MTASSSDSSRDTITRSAGRASLATFLSRILGLIRELVVARFFGAGMATDAFNVALRIPNLLRDLFAEGTLSAAFVPTFTDKLSKHGKEEAFLLANRVGSCLAILVGAICLVGFLSAEPIARFMAPGFAAIPGKLEVTITMTRVMMFFLLLVALAAATMGVLNSLGSFFIPALAPSFLSVGMILGAWALAPLMPPLGYDPVVGMAFGVMLGGLGQFLVQLPPLRQHGWRPRFLPSFNDPGVRRVAALMIPATVGLAATEFNIFMNTWIASHLVQGSVSWLNYAFRLVQLPIGVFGVAVGSATLPAVSRMLAEGRRADVLGSLTHSLTLVLALNLPASAGLVVLSEPITRLLYQGGHFSAGDTLQTAMALEAYCIGLFAYSGVKVVVPFFYALGDARVPTVISFVSVAINVSFNLAVMHRLGHVGLALGTSLSALVSFALLMALLRRRLGKGPSTLAATVRIGLATLVMGGVCHWLATEIVARAGTATLLARLAAVALPIAAGVATLAAVLWLLRAPELQLFTRALRLRRR